MPNLNLEPISRDDLIQIIPIESRAHIHPWSKSMLNDLEAYGALNYALKQDEKVVGYFYSQLIVDELSLMTIAVDPDLQGQGYGKVLMKHLIQIAKMKKAATIYLEVRVSNQAAIHLYQQFGFEKIATRSNYYPNPCQDNPHQREDALIMQCHLTS